MMIDSPATGRQKPLVLAIVLVLSCADTQARNTPDPDNVTKLDTVEVTAQRETRDQMGQSNVYLKDVSNVYAGKEEIERYKGTSAGDLFKGLNGVYSGDSRNSGAIDPNIRGIQGEGRIPVTVDGTQQSTTVYMVSAGVANRNYIDPNLIGSIMAEKGPSMTPGVASGMGGSVQIRTLEADDIVTSGDTFGIEVKLETATNSVAPDERSFSNFGKDYRDIHGAYIESSGTLSGAVVLPPGLDGYVRPRASFSGRDFKLEDNAYRAALAYKHDVFELLGAYSYRRRGNYFSGRHGSKRYENDTTRDDANRDYLGERYDPDDPDLSMVVWDNAYIGKYFKPGEEVVNTSNELESILLKGTLRLPDNQTIKAGYIYSDHTFGESSPWMVAHAIHYNTFRDDAEHYGYTEKTLDMHPQMPYSKVRQGAINLNYTWVPEDSPWINLNAGVWQTQSDSQRHQNGDVPFGLRDGENNINSGDQEWNRYVRCQIIRNRYASSCKGTETPPVREPNTDGRYTIIQKALQTGDHKRWGVNLSNRFDMLPGLNLTLSADVTREKLDQRDESLEYQTSYNTLTQGVNRLGPRGGSRTQYNAAFSINWAPTSWLQINAGYRYSDYNAFDELIARRREERSESWREQTPVIGYTLNYRSLMSDAEAVAVDNEIIANGTESYEWYQDNWQFTQDWLDMLAEEGDWEEWEIMNEDHGPMLSFDDFIKAELEEGKIDGVRYMESQAFVPIESGYAGFAEHNPFRNGEIDLAEKVTNAQGTNGQVSRYLTEGWGGRKEVLGIPPENPWQRPKKGRGHAWAPQIGMTFFLNEHARAYARYSQFIRFPSLFEFTQSIHGAMTFVTSTSPVGPEHAYNWEFGYVQDLRGLFTGMQHADFKINYFNNKIRDYIDREGYFTVIQFDEKRLSGIEVQTRFDTMTYFTNIGGTYRLEQKMCDRDYASFLDPIYGRVPDCVMAGFPRSFARTSLQPRYSINVDAGARLRNRKLQVGGRMVYHSSAKNKDEVILNDWAYNRPFYWNPIMVFDAYASYLVNKDVSIDFGVNNITNRYYLDPIARVSQPAPGRMLKFGVTARF